ncbi:MAG: hypothetical protein R3C11_14490 [Planctomycetaceae bacterium]
MRKYVPNVVVAGPVTRQVAIRGTRRVTYNQTVMTAYQDTRKVAEQRVRYVAEEVTRMVPRTVMKTIPSGTSVAYVPAGGVYGGTATAFAPTHLIRLLPAPRKSNESNNRTAEKPESTIRSRTDGGQSSRTTTPSRPLEPTPIRSRSLNSEKPADRRTRPVDCQTRFETTCHFKQ